MINKQNNYVFLLLTLLIGILLQSCTPTITTTSPDTTAPAEKKYVVPLPPGPIEVESGIIKITPFVLDDYLTNPGIGWQDGPEPFGILGFPETVDYSYRRQISWAILNPEDGLYNWSALDVQIETAVAEEKQFSFRVYTMVGEEFDDHAIPNWVITKGASLFPDGEPDYSSCIYQAEWGRFVNELAKRYDGNPDIAFIDISGYGNFNEWSWQDQQTEWDDNWDDFVNDGNSSPQDYFKTLDGQARRRLTDMFIGGAYQNHQCRNSDNSVSEIDYSYQGFQTTQLIMPYSGIVQSSEYVFARRPDVGFRYDCLGDRGEHVFEKINTVLSDVWKTAPVVFELCKPEDVEVSDASWLLEACHGSIVHNNNWEYDLTTLENLMKYSGYRYFLKEANIVVNNQDLNIKMIWENVGLAPSYPKMGQNFQLKVHLLDYYGQPVISEIVPVDISSWMPSIPDSTDAIEYQIQHSIQLSTEIVQGNYLLAIEILDLRTEKPILLPIGGRDENGLYVLLRVEIK